MSEFDWKDGSRLHCMACGKVTEKEQWISLQMHQKRLDARDDPSIEIFVDVTLLICPSCKTVRAL